MSRPKVYLSLATGLVMLAIVGVLLSFVGPAPAASVRSSILASDGAGRLSYPDIPSPTLTPGDVRTTDAREVCSTRTSTVRNVPESVKRRVYQEYGIDPYNHAPCEVDHLISLELGGSNSIKNLWPEHYDEPYGARDKDRLENRLHQLVCNGQLSLTDAQTAIRTDWIGAYHKYITAGT